MADPNTRKLFAAAGAVDLGRFVDAVIYRIAGGNEDRRSVEELTAGLRSGEIELADLLMKVPGAEFVPPGHFYSAIPSIEDWRRAGNWARNRTEKLGGIDLGESAQWQLMHVLAKYMKSSSLSEFGAPGHRYRFANPAYSFGDGLVLESMLRHFQPRRVIEVGSGWSSALLLDTAERFGGVESLLFIEPHSKLLHSLLQGSSSGLWKVEESVVQDVPVQEFERLGAGDLLFVDSTHVLKSGSDVCYLLLEVLPRLQPGVLVHFHDIFWPFEYPQTWMEERPAWNEIYALRLFLMFNRHWRIELFPNYLYHLNPDWFLCEIPTFARNPGGSLWLRRLE